MHVMGNNSDYIQAFASLETSIEIDNEILSTLDSFVCHMYGKKDAGELGISINNVRYLIYCQKSGKISCEALPPCWNSLKQHIKRSNYQSFVWRSSLKPLMDVNDPVGNGWCMNEGKLDIEWMTCNPAPDEILELVSCSCKSCEGNRCVCYQNGYSCTDACLCQGCNIREKDVDSNSDSGYFSEESLSDDDE